MHTPEFLRDFLGDGELIEEAIGRSANRVFRFDARDGDGLFLKVSAPGDGGTLAEEARRLRWLKSIGIAVPEVLALCTWQGRAWLVMTCLPGTDAAQADDPIATRVAVMAEALKDLHAHDASACPFDETLDVKVARAEDNVRRGLVRQDLFDAEHRDIAPEELVQRLRSMRPTTEDIVVTHGDACLPNVLIEDGRFSGFVDCGGAGRADRYQDLALASRSIGSNIGAEWVTPFFAAYGLAEVDEARVAYYRLLDEFI